MDVQNVCKTGDSFYIKAAACPVWDTDKSFLSCTSAFLLLPPPLCSDSSPRCLIQANPKKAGILLLCGGSRSPSGCHWGGTGSSHPAVFLTHPTALYRHRISRGIGLNLAKFSDETFGMRGPVVPLTPALSFIGATHPQTLFVRSNTMQKPTKVNTVFSCISLNHEKGSTTKICHFSTSAWFVT